MMSYKRIDWLLKKAQAAVMLTPWEQGFVDDLMKQLDRRGLRFSLSEKQEEILERIAEKD